MEWNDLMGYHGIHSDSAMAREQTADAESGYDGPTFPTNDPEKGRKLFDVQYIIGSVYSGTSEFSPFEAAMLIIGKHIPDTDVDADFTFPSGIAGETIHVRITSTKDQTA